MFGKSRRMNKLFVGAERRCLLSPLDHAGWLGPVEGLNRPKEIVQKVVSGGANALLASPGFFNVVEPVLQPSTGVVLRVSLTAGLSEQSTQETPISTIETALRMNADAVAVSVFFGREGDLEIYRWLASLVNICAPYDMPVVAEMMPPSDRFFEAEAIAHASRIGMEIGADVIKTNYCGNIAEFKDIVRSVPVPIIVAGGPKESGLSTIDLVREALEGGAVGVAIGRRVWQSEDPERLTRQIADVMWSS